MLRPCTPGWRAAPLTLFQKPTPVLQLPANKFLLTLSLHPSAYLPCPLLAAWTSIRTLGTSLPLPKAGSNSLHATGIPDDDLIVGVTTASSPVKQRAVVLTLAESSSVTKALPSAKQTFAEWNRILRSLFFRCSYRTLGIFVMKLASMHSFHTCVKSPTVQGPGFNGEAGLTSRGRHLRCI